MTPDTEGHWVGREKERYDFTLKLIEKKSTSRGYFVYRMKDKFNNFYIAFDGREEWDLPATKKNTHPEHEGNYTDDHRLQDGDCFTCKATVNRHDIANFKYGGPDSKHKQTVLNRIKLKEFIGRTDGYDSYNE
ncbi:uncharacterized protein METZ01_LOCUS366094 [marine metagenome]|uniref:Uncharacterized protein n=1 Tax=marine metagenome TaxID=408172 RepID=A0A382STK8_9ZZZZ